MAWINKSLISEPLNWGIVFLAASVWLLIFHTVMQGFNAMQSGASVPAAPGVAAQALPAATPVNAMAVTPSAGIWTDQTVARYAEDGWTGG